MMHGHTANSHSHRQCAWHAHSTHTACTWHAHSTHTARTQHAHGMHTVGPGACTQQCKHQCTQDAHNVAQHAHRIQKCFTVRTNSSSARCAHAKSKCPDTCLHTCVHKMSTCMSAHMWVVSRHVSTHQFAATYCTHTLTVYFA